MQRFHVAKIFFRRFSVGSYAFGGNDVLVKLPAIPMPPLLMEQVLRFVIGPVKKFIDFQRDLHGHSLSVIIDGNFHLPFLHSDFLVNLNEAAGSGTGDKVRAMLTRCSGSIGTKKRPDGIKPYERRGIYFAV
jgi:hypothetical protein